MSEYHIPTMASAPTPTRAPAQYAAIKACSESKLGLTPKEIVARTGVSRAIINTMIPMMLRIGRLHCVGPDGHRRYFATLAQADSVRDEVIAMIAKARADRKAASASARKAYNAKRHAAHMEKVRAERADAEGCAVPNPNKAPLRAKLYDEILRIKKGAATADLLSSARSSVQAVCKALSEMALAGIIHRVGKRGEFVYFATREDLAEFGPALEQKLLLKEESRKSPRHEKTVGLKITKAKTTKPSIRDMPAICPAHVKPQPVVGYTGDPRYTVTGPVVGGFATMGIGRYLDA